MSSKYRQNAQNLILLDKFLSQSENNLQGDFMTSNYNLLMCYH